MSLAVSRGELSPAQEEFKRRLAQAIDLKNQERYSDAAQILEDLRETNPHSASVHALLGHALWEQKELTKAVHSFKRAVKLSPESELASLGLFHTLMEVGDEQGAFQEMDRFRRAAVSKEYESLARELGNRGLKIRYAYVDNANVFIEGQRVAAVVRGMALNIEDAIRRRVFDFNWRLDFGKLHQILFGAKYKNGCAKLWGLPPSQDSLWKLVESKGWQVSTYDRNFEKESTVDVAMAYQIAKDAAHIDKTSSEIIIVTGDSDFVPIVQDLVAEGYQVTLAFWNHAASELREAAPFLPLDRWFAKLTH
jgi:uncharacterized LabA/DUF88 family protein